MNAAISLFLILLGKTTFLGLYYILDFWFPIFRGSTAILCTNHLTEGESHVPDTIENKSGLAKMRLREIIGPDAWAIKDIILALAIGWPTYLLFGLTGGPKRGFTSHFFVPNKLFPKEKLLKVMASNFGIGLMVYLLYIWAQKESFLQVLAVYIGPYMVVNTWLVGYTWLQHTDENVPHYDEDAWDWLKGALARLTGLILNISMPFISILAQLMSCTTFSAASHIIMPELPMNILKRLSELSIIMIVGMSGEACGKWPSWESLLEMERELGIILKNTHILINTKNQKIPIKNFND